MTELPNSWATAKFSDFGTWIGGGTPSKANPAFWNGDIPWISPKDMKSKVIRSAIDGITEEAIENSAAKLVPEGSVLIVTRSGILAHTLPIAITAMESALNQDLKALALPEGILSEFIAWGMRAFEQRILDACRKGGTTVHSIEMPRLTAFELPIAPTNEQRRIVERIDAMFDEIDHGVENLKKARATLGLYRQSLLKSAFEGRLTADWRARNADKLETPETLLARIQKERDTRYKSALDDWQKALTDWRENREKGSKPSKPRRQTEAKMDAEWLEKLPGLPAGASWVACNQLSGQISDGTHKTPKYTDGGIHFISAKDIRDFKVDFSDTRFVDAAQHYEMSKRCNVELGNVLLTKSGAIGRVAVVDVETPFSLFESVANIPVLPPMNSRYIAYAVYHIANSYFITHAEKGVAVRHLHLEDIRKMPVPLYSVSEQAEITRILDERLSAADALEAEIEASLTRAEALRQSILKQAFSGKLVPQDSDDEPAATLLARIKAQKATKPKKRRATNA